MNLLSTADPNSPLTTHLASRITIPLTKPPARLESNRIPSMVDGESTRTIRLGHVHLQVRELNRSLPFYREILGLQLTERVGRFAFLAAGNEHHSLALEEIGTWATRPPRRAVGVAHVAFEVPDSSAFGAMKQALLAADVPFISRKNGISWAMRFHDTDGNEIEVYVDRRHAPGGLLLWKGQWPGRVSPKSGGVLPLRAGS